MPPLFACVCGERREFLIVVCAKKVEKTIKMWYNSINSIFGFKGGSMMKFDRSIFNEDCHSISIGVLDNEKIKFLIEKAPYLEERIVSRSIVFWENRMDHIEKHKDDFRFGEFDNAVASIPEIIKYPDYIGVRPKDDSIQFVKSFDKHLLVAVRVELNGTLTFRTMYPVTEGQIEDYMRKNRLWKYDAEKKLDD